MIWHLLVALTVNASATNEAELAQGAYLVKMAGCTDCHTVTDDKYMAGRFELKVPNFGVFITPNLTPDMDTGLGKWSEADFRRALREGRGPDGTFYYPSFPYRSFSKLTDEDMRKMYLYLRSIPPIKQVNLPHQLEVYVRARTSLAGWQAIFFWGQESDPQRNIKIGQGPFKPDAQMSAEWNRGAYLVEAAFHCTECHTDRNMLGGLNVDKWMGGASRPVGGMYPPDITPNALAWTRAQWLTFLNSGFRPNQQDPVRAEMFEVIQNTSALTAPDKEAVITYMRSLPSVSRQKVEQP